MSILLLVLHYSYFDFFEQFSIYNLLFIFKFFFYCFGYITEKVRSKNKLKTGI